jgi:hypothetical protein
MAPKLTLGTSAIFKKLHNVNNRPKGKKSPNLVTLLYIGSQIRTPTALLEKNFRTKKIFHLDIKILKSVE